MKRIETTIAEGAGKVDNVDEWGKRKLAYEINGLTDGDYTLVNFHADPQNVAENSIAFCASTMLWSAT